MAISYKDLGLVNSKDLFAKAVEGGGRKVLAGGEPPHRIKNGGISDKWFASSSLD